jgi:hypothetical protein
MLAFITPEISVKTCSGVVLGSHGGQLVEPGGGASGVRSGGLEQRFRVGACNGGDFGHGLPLIAGSEA